MQDTESQCDSREAAEAKQRLITLYHRLNVQILPLARFFILAISDKKIWVVEMLGTRPADCMVTNCNSQFLTP